MMSATKMCSTMLAMLVLSVGNADASSFAGSYTRTSVSPDACNVPTNCHYQCAATYTITESGSSLIIEPTSTPTASDCTCSKLSATVSGTTASGTLGSSISYDLEQTGSGIAVTTTIDGTTCKGTYTPTTTTTTTTSDAWTYSGADLLGLAMTGMAIYYQG